jgi:hypothetical protein
MRDKSHRDSEPAAGVVRTHWVLAVCGFCRHELPCGENHRAACPGCGAPLHFSPLFRGPRGSARTDPRPCHLYQVGRAALTEPEPQP